MLGRLGPADRVCEQINPRGPSAFPEILFSRPSELSGAEEMSYALWLSVCAAFQSSTRICFSSGLSGESAPVRRQRLAFAASVWSKNKKKRRIRRRFEGGRREGASSKEEESSKEPGSEIGSLTSLDACNSAQVHPMTTESQFHCNRLYRGLLAAMAEISQSIKQEPLQKHTSSAFLCICRFGD